MAKQAVVAAVSSYLPAETVNNSQLLERIKAPFELPKAAHLERLFGIQQRHWAAADEQVSDLACRAAAPILAKIDPLSIDLLIFAAACADLIEPATANIVQQKLGLKCPVFDVKNACNSFVTAIQIADAFIKSGNYQRILIVNGEKVSDAVRLNIQTPHQFVNGLAALTLGDAGAAMLLETENSEHQDAKNTQNTEGVSERGFVSHDFMTVGEHWQLCTIQGGGSMFPHDADRLYFEGQTAQLKNVIAQEATQFIKKAVQKLGWQADEIDFLLTHQVSAATFQIVAETVGVPLEKCVNIFPDCGNMAAASIIVGMDKAQTRFRRGDKILIVGLAAGISVSVQGLIW